MVVYLQHPPLEYHSYTMSEPDLLIASIAKLKDGGTLSSLEMEGVFRTIMSGNASDGFIGAFLGILATRVPTHEELLGAAIVMRECVTGVRFPNANALLDTCGTGGAPKTFNVSTAASVVVAASGVRVAKHGNKSRTGRGSAEVLEALGIQINIDHELQTKCLEEVGICFCFAPNHHKSVAHVMPVRRALKFPTIFNLLGPLTNPCSAGRQLLGVWEQRYVEPVAHALHSLGTVKSAVVHSEDGLDEISIASPSHLSIVHGGTIQKKIISPEEFGLHTHQLSEVTATSLDAATEMFIQSMTPTHISASKDMLLMSAGTSLYLADQTETIKEGVEVAKETIERGLAMRTLQDWIEITNTHTPSTG